MKLIDIFELENKLFAWVLDRKNEFTELDFKPKVYVYARRNDLVKISKKVPSRFIEKKTLKGIKRVLEIQTEIKFFKPLIREIDRSLNYSCEMFNSDIPIDEYFLFENDLFPGANIKDFRTNDFAFDNYEIPDLKQLKFSIETSHPILSEVKPRLERIKVNEEVVDIHNFVNIFKKDDPDIIISDSREMIFLLNEIRKYYPDFSYSRRYFDIFKSGGSSFVTYGRVIHKANATYLKGRLHFQPKGVLYGSWNLWMPFELARICRVPLQRINQRSVGYGVTALQVYHALKRGFLIPKRTSCVEQWKSGTDLFNADRGSLIYEPEIGFHNNIAEIDFTSLFPSIMVNENLSTETLFCRCCRNKVPGLNITVCKKQRGIMSDVLEPIIKQRECYKRSGKESDLYKADALKGILVCSFGYMGFRKSRFARIETHQAIQAFAREILLESSKIAEELGFQVVHGIVDSLWIKRNNISLEKVQELVDLIYERTGYRCKIEGLYRWLVFLPSTQNEDLPVSTRFYGVFENGQIKCRGIELRKHDSPLIMNELQQEIVEHLEKAGSEAEFVSLMKESMRFLKKAIDRLINGQVTKEDLIITKGISKTDYSSDIAQSIILKKLKKQGFSPSPGQYIKYIIRDKNSSFPMSRYITTEEQFFYDKQEYIRLLRESVRHLFIPFLDRLENQRIIHDYTGAPIEELPLQVKEGSF